ncbi:hypothetical protein, partial [Pseudomonas syringae group genomosp. 7]|uniref:hypothetical protein n=1 Tax=Pseudomonas syringae group genomosp. 7 TaxID=251699 RepID=UPI00376FE2CF
MFVRLVFALLLVCGVGVGVWVGGLLCGCWGVWCWWLGWWVWCWGLVVCLWWCVVVFGVWVWVWGVVSSLLGCLGFCA